MACKNQFGQLIGALVENWAPRPFPSKETLRGSYCILEPLAIDKHAADLFAVLADNGDESWTYLPYGPFNSCNEFCDWLKKMLAEADTQLYVILDRKTHAPIGICGYLRINPEYGVIEVGHLHFSKLLKRSPAATEAMYLMMRRAFEQLKYRRYEWKCNSLNQASRNAAERLGFKFEGIFRQHFVVKNHNRDTAWFSIIDSEWPALKERFQKWLAPNNFDTQGKQITALRDI
jgi:RimJ/RimL family protein N-acetyltransferase